MRAEKPGVSASATIVDVEVCGELQCQFAGMGEWVAVFVEVGRGALSICSSRAAEQPEGRGQLISTARLPDLAQLIVRRPKSARPSRPHCLRLELPMADSRGARKYVLDMGTADNLRRWQRSLSCAAGLATADDGVAEGGAAAAAAAAGGGAGAKQLLALADWVGSLRLGGLSYLSELLLGDGLGEGDGADDEDLLELSPRSVSMRKHHKQAQLEAVRNSIVIAKRRLRAVSAAASGASAQDSLDGDDLPPPPEEDEEEVAGWVSIDDSVAYRNWLQAAMPGDYDNEFVACSRKNEALHELWAATSPRDVLVNDYTDERSGDIAVDKVERQVLLDSAPLHEVLTLAATHARSAATAEEEEQEQEQEEGRRDSGGGGGGGVGAARELLQGSLQRLREQLAAQPDPNLRAPLVSKVRVVETHLLRLPPEPEPEPELEPEPEPEGQQCEEGVPAHNGVGGSAGGGGGGVGRALGTPPRHSPSTPVRVSAPFLS
jgi:hypothetical protein